MEDYSNFPFSPESLEKDYPGYSKLKRNMTVGDLRLYSKYKRFFPFWFVSLYYFVSELISFVKCMFLVMIYLFVGLFCIVSTIGIVLWLLNQVLFPQYKFVQFLKLVQLWL